jgi:hypothetical protein
MSHLVKAIRHIKPEAQFSFTNEDYSTVKWDYVEGDVPTQEEINAALILLENQAIENAATKLTQRQAILDRLGLTAEEAALLLGGN